MSKLVCPYFNSSKASPLLTTDNPLNSLLFTSLLGSTNSTPCHFKQSSLQNANLLLNDFDDLDKGNQPQQTRNL